MGKYQEEAKLHGEQSSGEELEFIELAEDSQSNLDPPKLTFQEYQMLAGRTAGTHETQLDAVLNWTLGLSGEAGEFANLVKKTVYHKHELDYGKVVSELGDVLWYISQLCEALGLSLDTVAEQNLRKLSRRYPKGFSSQDSINRTD